MTRTTGTTPSIGPSIGIDFGTTNSSVAFVRESGESRETELAAYPFMGALTDSYRSLLYLEQAKEAGRDTLKSWTGPAGIERYLEAENKGRLIQSLKSFLGSRTLKTTEVFGRRRTLEELVARILKDLRGFAEQQFGVAVRSAVVGRPVRFVGAENDDDNQYAEDRLQEAFRIAGFDTVEFELEPIAAAYYYESTLEDDELILIGDFGGGTSDFSLIHVGPGIRRRGRKPEDLLGNAGIGIAGDAFDAKIVRKLVSPALGAGTQMRSVDKILPVPVWVYAKVEKWHHLSFLRTKEVMNMLRSVEAQAIEPEKIAALVHLIREDLGYQLHRSVQAVKCELSEHSSGTFQFSDGVVNLEKKVQRDTFESWISPELHQIGECVDSLLKGCGVRPEQVDKVFLTGGSSFVPAVRRIFESRFGADRIRAGNEFTSVARGLALKGRDSDSIPGRAPERTGHPIKP
jgi:hypothetical chaperone protein